MPVDSVGEFPFDSHGLKFQRVHGRYRCPLQSHGEIEAVLFRHPVVHAHRRVDIQPHRAVPDIFSCFHPESFLDSVQMTIDGVKAYRKVAQVEFGKWWKMDPSPGMVQTPGY